MIKAKMALYVVWKGESLSADAATVVNGWLGGRATHFVIEDKIGITTKADWRKVLLDLNTMKVIAADPASGKGLSEAEMIKKCKALQGD